MSAPVTREHRQSIKSPSEVQTPPSDPTNPVTSFQASLGVCFSWTLRCFLFLIKKSVPHWSTATNKQMQVNGSKATGADTDRTVQLVRGRNSQWGGWHVFYQLRSVHLTKKKKRKPWGERRWNTINTSELTDWLSAMRGLTPFSKTWGNIHVTSREGLKPTCPL